MTTNRASLRQVIDEARASGPVVVASPLRCLDSVFYRRRLAEQEIGAMFVSLRARYKVVAAGGRGRSFSDWERRRIAQMIEQDYGERAFRDFVNGVDDDVDTGVERPKRKVAERAAERP